VIQVILALCEYRAYAINRANFIMISKIVYCVDSFCLLAVCSSLVVIYSLSELTMVMI